MRRIRAVIVVVVATILCFFCGSQNAVEKESITVKMREYENSHSQHIVQVKTLESDYYVPTQEEREMAYKVAIAEAGIEDEFAMSLVINCAVNNMKALNLQNLMEEFNQKNRYSSMINGKPYIITRSRNILITDDMVTDEVKEAVDRAFQYDYSKELLTKEAEESGYDDPIYYQDGARFFYNPDAVSEKMKRQRDDIKVSFTYKNHVYYSYWG